jgi:hypothetical protein
MIKYSYLLVWFLSALSITRATAQEKVTINGYVKDVSSGEELIGVSVYIPALKAGTITNAYGFYAITVPKGEYDVQFTYIGYVSKVITVSLQADAVRNIELENEATMIQEIVVSDKPINDNVVSIQMSKNTINMSQVKKLPAVFGEVDIVKSVQMMPGVISAGEGTSTFFVRGGSGDQNLILIDEAPIYDPSHLFGLFSVFNADVVKDVDLYKGGIPARYGGRLSSILDVRTIDGNNKQIGVTGGIGTMASRLMVEGPIVKEKSSFVVSGRTSNLGAYLKAADTDSKLGFYDINAKANWRASNKNRFFLTLYSGRDRMTFDQGDVGFGWGNSTATFRWNHLFNERLFSNISVIGSRFDYKLEIKDAVQGIRWTSDLKQVSMKADFDYVLNTNNELNFGYHVTGKQFAPGSIVPNSKTSMFAGVEYDKMYALDHALYINNQQSIGESFVIDYGLRASIFQNIGPSDVYIYSDRQNNVNIERIDTLHFDRFETIKSYINLEPRVGIRYALSDAQSLKMSYNRMVQNTHLMSAATVPVPFNTWSPSDYYLKPQLADQVAAGYFRNLKDNMYEVSLEAYYKDMKNVTDFADNAEIFFNQDLPTEYRQGKSWSYGTELMVNKTRGKLTGSVSYTLSKTMRKIPGVNQGKAFIANYDRRHVLNVQAAYDLNSKWTFGGTFSYSTGRPLTLPAGRYEYGNYNPDVITERNGYLLPDFHRLDLSATLNPRKNEGRKWKAQWVFSLYNVYNRKNPFTVYTRSLQDKDGNVIGDGSQKEARLIYLFPIMPSVTYNFKF